MTQNNKTLDIARKPYVEVCGWWCKTGEDFYNYKVAIGWNPEDTEWDGEYLHSCDKCTSRAEAVKELTSVAEHGMGESRFCIPAEKNITTGVMYELDENLEQIEEA